VPDNSSFMKNIFDDIESNFKLIIERFEYDAGLYLELDEKNSRNLQPLANIFE
jgi:hypothetical protein